jgi:hypothetical protein
MSICPFELDFPIRRRFHVSATRPARHVASNDWFSQPLLRLDRLRPAGGRVELHDQDLRRYRSDDQTPSQLLLGFTQPVLLTGAWNKNQRRRQPKKQGDSVAEEMSFE